MDKVYILCPKCGSPMFVREAVDTKLCYTESGIAELSIPYSEDPRPIQERQCSKCGYKKYAFLLGLPDDDKSYPEWANDEGRMLILGESP